MEPSHERTAAGTKRVLLLTLALAASAVGLLLAHASRDAAEPHGALMFVIVLAGFFAAEVFPVHIGLDVDNHTISFNELPLAIGLVTLSPLGLAASAVLGSGAALLLQRRQRGAKLAFNLAAIAVQALVAYSVFSVLDDGAAAASVSTCVAVAAALLVADSLSALLVTLAIALFRGTTNGVSSARALLGGAAESGPKAMLGALAVAAILNDNPLGLVIGIAVSVIAYVGYRTYLAARTGASLAT